MVRVRSYTQPPESLLQHRSWWLRGHEGDERLLEVLQGQWDGHALRVRLDGVNDRTAAERLRGHDILLERAALPPVAAREYYQEDLVGCVVRNLEGVELGRLTHFLDAPAGSLMVVRGAREYWLPAAAPCLRRVDMAQGEILVDWPADF